MLRAGLVSSLAAVALTATPALAAHTSTCDAKGIGAKGSAKVVKLQATGLSCTKALQVARTVATQVGHGGSINVPGVAGFAMSTETCTGCGGTTMQISLTYQSGGKVTISIRGGSGKTVPGVPTVPEPQLPAPSGGSGTGPITV